LKSVDTLITHARLLTMEGPGVGYMPDAAVAIKGDTIEAAGPSEELQRQYTAQRYLDAAGDIILPGFIDAHIHTGLALLRGTAQDMEHWMQLGIWPFRRHLSEGAAALGALVNIMEAMKAGTTTFCDYNSGMNQILPHYEQLGARVRAAETIHSLPADLGPLEPGELYPLNDTVGAERLEANAALYDQWHGRWNDRITVMFGPQGPDLIGKELLLETAHEARQRGAGLHMHVAQGDREMEQMEKRWGCRSPQYLDQLGLLGPDLMAVHLTEASASETELIARSGASMIYCAGSIGIIDGLVPPIAAFLDAGGRAALGSDQVPGNNCASMFNEMKLTALFNKIKQGRPQAFPAWKVLRLATIEGAEAIGLADTIGSVKPGKRADLIALDADAPTLNPVLEGPVRNIVPNIVYSARGSEVRWSMVDGDMIVEHGQITGADEKKAIKAAQAAAEACAAAAVDDLRESPLKKWTEQGYL